jgi:hypothetical protein
LGTLSAIAAVGITGHAVASVEALAVLAEADSAVDSAEAALVAAAPAEVGNLEVPL